jgi:hypothetical protein
LDPWFEGGKCNPGVGIWDLGSGIWDLGSEGIARVARLAPFRQTDFGLALKLGSKAF